MLIRILYQAFTGLLPMVFALGRHWNPKMKAGYLGRKNQNIPNLSSSIWIHCASHGEFLMIAPVIGYLKSVASDRLLDIVVTFFSPSGMDNAGAQAYTDHVYYMPFDRKRNMAYFIDRLNPVVACFVKAEFWYNSLDVLQDRGIPYIFTSTIFRKDKYPLAGFGSFYFMQRLRSAGHIFTQDVQSKEVLTEFGISQVTTAGNPRLDHVLHRKENRSSYDLVEEFKGKRKLLIVGSSWSAEENLCRSLLPHTDEYKFLIAPHDISNHRIQEIYHNFGTSTLLYSEAIEDDYRDLDESNVMIVDKIGMLADLYQYADFVLVGGGFGRNGLHNTLEPVVYGIPVCFGPNYSGFPEVEDLVDRGLMYVVRDVYEIVERMNYFDNEDHRNQLYNDLQSYFKQNVGASKIIFEYLKSFIPNR